MWLVKLLLHFIFLPIALCLGILRYIHRRFTYVPPAQLDEKQRIAIVGGGIAGCGAAFALKKSGHVVVLYEERDVLGGNAKTYTWNAQDGPVTGLSVLAWPKEYFHNYESLISALGIKTEPVNLSFFTNFVSAGILAHGEDTPLKRSLAKDFAKWDKMVSFVKNCNWVLTGDSKSIYAMSYINPLNVIPLKWLLHIFRISDEFWNYVVIPVYSSTFLTINIGSVPAVVAPLIDGIIPLTKDPSLTTWSNNSAEVFTRMTKGVDVRLSTPVQWIRRMANNEIYVTDSTKRTEKFHKIIFACPSSIIPKMISSPSYLERKLLSWVTYTDDSDNSFLEGIVHSDVDVLPEKYRLDLTTKFANYIEVSRKEGGGFHLENTFLLSSWIPTIRRRKKAGIKDPYMFITYNSKKVIKYQAHKIDNIRAHPDLSFRNLIISSLLRFLQGYKGTYFCASYTTPGNGHDLSLLSGFVVAHDISGSYPFDDNLAAASDFKKLRRLMGL